MKPSLLLTMVAMLALPSCEKIRSFKEQLGKKPTATPTAPATSAAPEAPVKPAVSAPSAPATPVAPVKPAVSAPTAPVAPVASAKPVAAYKGEVVSEIAGSGYEAFTQMTGRVIVVDFYADWSGPCRSLAPILQNIATEKQGLVLVGKVNLDKEKLLAGTMNVRGIPDVRIFRDGKQVDRFVGLPDEATLRKKIENHLKGLPPLPAETKTEAKTEAKTEPDKPKPPPIQPMSKDWMPPGIKRR